METTEPLKCSLCSKDAIGRYSPDLDVKGLTFCDEHKDKVGAAFYCLMNDNIEDFNALMGTKYNPNESNY